MRPKLKTNRATSLATPLKVIGTTAGLLGLSGVIYKTLALGFDAGFGPSAGFARSFSEVSDLNAGKSSILAGSVLTSVGALMTGISIISARK